MSKKLGREGRGDSHTHNRKSVSPGRNVKSRDRVFKLLSCVKILICSLDKRIIWPMTADSEVLEGKMSTLKKKGLAEWIHEVA